MLIFAANLAIEEMVSNTIKYGYRDGLEHQIEIQLSLGASDLEIEICDDGASIRSIRPPNTTPFGPR